MSEFKGDYRGIVSVEFTTESLSELIETWNRTLPITLDGTQAIRLRADEYEPGKAVLIAMMEQR